MVDIVTFVDLTRLSHLSACFRGAMPSRTNWRSEGLGGSLSPISSISSRFRSEIVGTTRVHKEVRSGHQNINLQSTDFVLDCDLPWLSNSFEQGKVLWTDLGKNEWLDFHQFSPLFLIGGAGLLQTQVGEHKVTFRCWWRHICHNHYNCWLCTKIDK